MIALLDHQKFKQALFEKHITQEAFAESIGISDRHVRNLSSKDTNVSISILHKICIALNMPMESLLTFLKEDGEE